MDAIYAWGIEVIAWMQQASPALDGFFKAMTFLGSEEAYLLLVPLIYWSIDRIVGVRATILLLVSALVNAGAKAIADQPRPIGFDPSTNALVEETSPGFPSGHTQNTVAVFGYLAVQAKRRWFWVAAIALMVLVPLSRIYLGVHFPTDVLGGYLIGGLLLWLFLRYWVPFERWFCRQSTAAQLVLVVAVPLLALGLRPTADIATGAGTLLGMAVGFIVERRWIRFETPGSIVQRALRFVVGIVVLVAIWAGLRAAFQGLEPALLLRTIRYGLVGLWGAAGAPWLFVTLRLAPRG
jgi:membrane-associated phospholipid phosphatase